MSRKPHILLPFLITCATLLQNTQLKIRFCRMYFYGNQCRGALPFQGRLNKSKSKGCYIIVKSIQKTYRQQVIFNVNQNICPGFILNEEALRFKPCLQHSDLIKIYHICNQYFFKYSENYLEKFCL